MLINIKCYHCGAEVQTDDSETQVFCEACGTKLMVPVKTFTSYPVNTANDGKNEPVKADAAQGGEVKKAPVPMPKSFLGGVDLFDKGEFEAAYKGLTELADNGKSPWGSRLFAGLASSAQSKPLDIRFRDGITAAKNAAIVNESAKGFSNVAIGPAADGLNSAKDQFSGASQAARSLADGLQQAVGGFGSDNEPGTLINAAAALKSGADQIDSGLAMLESKSGELATGMSQIASGVSQISQGASQLSDATQQAADGSNSMAEGLQQFNDEGVSKIADAIDNRIVKLGNRLVAVTDAGGFYKNFAGITDGTTGSVKFVFETEAIKND